MNEGDPGSLSAAALPSSLIAGLPTFMLRPAASGRFDPPMPTQASTLAANP